MARPPDFSAPTVELLAYRSAHICNNPQCNILTVGPSLAAGDLVLKLGEAAHICEARDKTARYDDTMSDEQRAHPNNGIWLCSRCHTAVDKNDGADFPTPELHRWKIEHEATIATLIKTHRSPLPLIRRQSANQKLAQDAVDCIAGRGAFFNEFAWEEPSHLVTSVEQARRRIERCRRQIDLDTRLRDILRELINALRVFMNETSRFPEHFRQQLPVLRSRIGVGLIQLRDEYGCSVTGEITRILPS